MEIKIIRDASLNDLAAMRAVFVAACGYETRSAALIPILNSRLVRKFAICFEEWPEALSRPRNEAAFKAAGFDMSYAKGGDMDTLTMILEKAVMSALENDLPLIFDISSMTRAWHGAVVRYLATVSTKKQLRVYFIYVPARFQPPPRDFPPNEIVAPVQGFASLNPADLPVAVVIGLGYERERAMGLQQLLDPERTLLMVPRFKSMDKFYPRVINSNRDILGRVPDEYILEYALDQPAATFQLLRTITGGLRESYRVVLASLGPKLFGLICFLLASAEPGLSVWRVSSGSHGSPRDARAELSKIVVLETRWSPNRLP